MHLQIKEARPVPRCQTSLKSDNGRRRVGDFAPFLDQVAGSSLTPYRSLNQFKSVHPHGGDLMRRDFEMIFCSPQLVHGRDLKDEMNMLFVPGEMAALGGQPPCAD